MNELSQLLWMGKIMKDEGSGINLTQIVTNT